MFEYDRDAAVVCNENWKTEQQLRRFGSSECSIEKIYLDCSISQSDTYTALCSGQDSAR